MADAVRQCIRSVIRCRVPILAPTPFQIPIWARRAQGQQFLSVAFDATKVGTDYSCTLGVISEAKTGKTGVCPPQA